MAGDAYWLKVRGSRSGRPVQLVPISPDRVRASGGMTGRSNFT